MNRRFPLTSALTIFDLGTRGLYAMRSIFQRLRSEHLGIPLVYLHSAYATSKKITRWNPGAVMYDLNIDELIRQR